MPKRCSLYLFFRTVPALKGAADILVLEKKRSLACKPGVTSPDRSVMPSMISPGSIWQFTMLLCIHRVQPSPTDAPA